MTIKITNLTAVEVLIWRQSKAFHIFEHSTEKSYTIEAFFIWLWWKISVAYALLVRCPECTGWRGSHVSLPSLNRVWCITPLTHDHPSFLPYISPSSSLSQLCYTS